MAGFQKNEWMDFREIWAEAFAFGFLQSISDWQLTKIF